MNKITILICLFTVVLVTETISQSDTTWTTYLCLGIASDKTPINMSQYSTKSSELILQKGNHTIVPEAFQRSIHQLVGYQFGVSYYKKFDWGYTHGNIRYSQSEILPQVSYRANIFYLLANNLVVNAGLYRFSYQNGINASIYNIGASVYYKSTMTTGTVKIADNGNPQYIGTFRKYSKNDSDYLQIRISNSFEQGIIIGDINSNFSTLSYQLGVVKTIAEKLQVQVSIGLSSVQQSEQQNKFYNYSVGLKRRL